jgi:heme oxygenase (biliverdin-producing, ferredoxin)
MKKQNLSAVDTGPSTGLAAALRERTRTQHTRAERSGIVNAILRRQATRFGYALFLRNLVPVYQQLEAGLSRHLEDPGVRAIALPQVYRASALASDIAALGGDKLPVLQAGERYEEAVRAAADGGGTKLIGHAYVRYLGDLSGGQVMKRLLVQSLALESRQLSFYDFPDVGDVEAFKLDYRSAIDVAGTEIDQVESVLDEAALAFELNIALSQAVLKAAISQLPAGRRSQAAE